MARVGKILIADDNEQITSILSNYAQKEGFEPIVALDGEEAIAKFINIARKYKSLIGCNDAEERWFRSLP